MRSIGKEQLYLVRIGMHVAEFLPEYTMIQSMEELAVFMNETFNMNVQRGDPLDQVCEELEKKVAIEKFNRSMGVL